MNSICLNGGADLILAGQIRHGKRGESPCSMGALSWLGKDRVYQEFRLIDTPESIHNYKGFFTSAVLHTKTSGMKLPAWNKWFRGSLTSRPRRIADARGTINR